MKTYYFCYVVESNDVPNILSSDYRYWYSDLAKAMEHFDGLRKGGKLSLVTMWKRASGFVPKSCLSKYHGETLILEK